jgi:hypothetical protein
MAWITDMTHYLDAEGRIPPMRAPAARLADYFGAIAVVASDPQSPAVRCRKRPGHRAFPGLILMDREHGTNDVA